MKIISGVYAITNICNGHKYIGSSNDIGYRWRRHPGSLLLNKHFNAHLQSAFNKYGKESFSFQILMPCSPKECVYYEQEFMDYFLPLYNASPTAYSVLGIKRSDATRRKISDSKKGKKLGPRSEETRCKIGNGNRGKIVSTETRIKLSQCQLGKKRGPLSKEHRRKIGEANHRRIITEETRKKLRGNNLGKIFGPRSEEIRRKISKAHQGMKASEQALENMREAWKIRKEQANIKPKGENHAKEKTKANGAPHSSV